MKHYENTPTEHVIKMLGGQLLKNKCPEYFIWKFPNEPKEIEKMRLPLEIEKFQKLTRPTFKKIDFINDFNNLMFGIKCAKYLWIQIHKLIQDKGTTHVDYINNQTDVFNELGRADMEIDFALRTVDSNKIFDALVEFAKIYNEKKDGIFS